MELYLVRHGETIWNQEKRYYGHSDVGLAPSGYRQAEELGTYFKKIKFDEVIVSPLIRAKETAKALTNQPFLFEPRLMEQNFGLFEGKTYQQLQREYPNELKEWNQDWQEYCLPEGESFHMVRNRVEDFSKELWSKKGKILLVAHKGTFGHLMASLLKMPLSGYWNFVFEQNCYSRIDLEDGFAIVRCLNGHPCQFIHNIQE